MANVKNKKGTSVPSEALPHNLEAERAVIGSMLMDDEAMLVALERLHEEHFYHPPHRIIFEAVRALSANNQEITLTTLAEYLDRHKQLGQAGGVYYLGDVAQSVATSTQVRTYASIIRHRALLRKLIVTSGEIAERAQSSGEDADAVLAWAEQRIFDLAVDTETTTFQPIANFVDPVIKKAISAYENSGIMTGIPSGFRDLDEKTNGFQKSDLIILAARPGVGKTSIALNIASNVGYRKQAVAIFSMEMAAEQLTERILCSRAKINLKRLRDGFLNRAESTQLIREASSIAEFPIYIDDSTYLTPSDIASRVRHLKTRVPEVCLVIIDYLQLMHGDRKRESRQLEVADISRSLKLMARNLKLPVLALAQLSRAVETRSEGGGKRRMPGSSRPKLSDLRESGAIEQDADIVIFLHREPREDVEPDNVPENLYNAARFKHELVIEKHRNGPTGVVPIHFQPEFTRFDDVSSREVDIPETGDYGAAGIEDFSPDEGVPF